MFYQILQKDNAEALGLTEEEVEFLRKYRYHPKESSRKEIKEIRRLIKTVAANARDVIEIVNGKGETQETICGEFGGYFRQNIEGAISKGKRKLTWEKGVSRWQTIDRKTESLIDLLPDTYDLEKLVKKYLGSKVNWTSHNVKDQL